MRLVGIELNSRPWVAVETPDGPAPVAEVDAFFADVEGNLARAKASPAAAVRGCALVVPIPLTAKVLCAGLNYVNHIAESKRQRPTAPDIFARWRTTLVTGCTEVPIPTGEPGLDWEGELAAVIGRPLKNATPEEVEDAVLGYTILNDLSARKHQRASVQWCVGKNADKSAPFGPAIVTRDEIPDPYALRLETRVDGVVMQSERTGEMLFRIGQIGAFASETMTLQPGDVIATGTPAGVGAARNPPVFLQQGQVVEIEIEKIGRLSTPIGGQ
ncbi:fumarylacetoacetate hydrolase family protein [Ruixingdingia sedimenti]|uniref:Fumarylacetoacetate hydrolase family protein n=1 Tax=Ruixingdingia sedimenti TaxID=3073604 RepID=A0ABU1FAW5_9RHOB|nr:fumarylacetoacetate hydrolase family protein [Xinfangfangia sp. LG-4]MDR5654006.1 fumarylacetoacetate hydrolase family protein [Xinfangfangia sp. LG-4]